MSCGGDSIIPLEMLRYSASFAFALCLCGAACSTAGRLTRPSRSRPPSVSVTPSRRGVGDAGRARCAICGRADAPPFEEDYTVFVHVLDDDGRMIGAADHLPPTPTRQWKAGSTVEYKHAGLRAGLGLRRRRDASSSDSIRSRRASGCRWLARPSSHERSRPDRSRCASAPNRMSSSSGRAGTRRSRPRGQGSNGAGPRSRARLTFANPKRDALLTLELDQPSNVFPVPQHIEIRMGDDGRRRVSIWSQGPRWCAGLRSARASWEKAKTSI